MINGINIFISLDSQQAPFAGTKSNEIQTECETIEISSPVIGDWRQYIAGRKEWSFTVGWLVGATSSISQLLNAGQTYSIIIYGRNGSSVTALLEGSAILKTCKITAAKGTLCQGSFTFIGTSELAAPSA